MKLSGESSQNYHSFNHEDIIVMLLKSMLSNFLEIDEIADAVVTSSLSLSDTEWKTLKSSLNIVNLNMKEIISHTSAVVIGQYFEYQKKMHSSSIKNVLVFDMGGGNFEVAVASIKRGGYGILAFKDSKHLCGDAFTNKIMEHFIANFYLKHAKLITEDILALNKLRIEVEKAKISLSTKKIAKIRINSFYEGIDFDETLTRDQFNALNINLFHRVVELTQLAIIESKLDSTEIDEVLFVGSSTDIPQLKQLIIKQLNFNNNILSHQNLTEAAVLGAAYKAGDQTDNEFGLTVRSSLFSLNFIIFIRLLFFIFVMLPIFIILILFCSVLIIVYLYRVVPGIYRQFLNRLRNNILRQPNAVNTEILINKKMIDGKSSNKFIYPNWYRIITTEI